MTGGCPDQKTEWRRIMLGERSWRVRLQPG